MSPQQAPSSLDDIWRMTAKHSITYGPTSEADSKGLRMTFSCCHIDNRDYSPCYHLLMISGILALDQVSPGICQLDPDNHSATSGIVHARSVTAPYKWPYLGHCFAIALNPMLLHLLYFPLSNATNLSSHFSPRRPWPCQRPPRDHSRDK